MKILTTLLGALLLLLSVSTYAKNESSNKDMKSKTVLARENATSVFVTGNIIDRANNETLAGATIYVNGEKVYSDLDGNFIFKNLKPGKHLLKAELISYENSELEVNIIQNSKVTIHLIQK